MKNIIPKISLLAMLATTQTNAQDYYLKLGTGYAVAMPGQMKDQLGNVLNGTVTVGAAGTSYNTKSASFTAGQHLTVGIGRMLSKNVGLELNADINILPKVYDAEENNVTLSSGGTANLTEERKAKGSILFEPALLVTTAPDKGCRLYMRNGIVLPVNTGITLNEGIISSGQYQTAFWTIHNFFSMGFASAAGINFDASKNKRLSIWCEASMVYLSIFRSQMELTGVDMNGTYYPSSKISGTKTYNYTRNGTTNSLNDRASFSQPYSNLGISAGIAYKLEPKKEHNKKIKDIRKTLGPNNGQ